MCVALASALANECESNASSIIKQMRNVLNFSLHSVVCQRIIFNRAHAQRVFYAVFNTECDDKPA